MEIPEVVDREFLQYYAAKPEWLATGGFSQSTVLRCVSDQGKYCLRASPVLSYDEQRCERTRLAVQATWDAGLDLLPRYLPGRSGSFFIPADGRIWELSHWMPGTADYGVLPSPKKRASALKSLAKLHRVWRMQASLQVSPAVAQRIGMLRGALDASVYNRLQTACWGDLNELAQDTATALLSHGPTFLSDLMKLQYHPVPTHFVLRDVWSEHLLFSSDHLTGIIDLGAARVDEAATDLARLLGSIEPLDNSAWLEGFEAYRKEQPDINLHRVQVLDRCSCLLSAVQWAKWLLLENRSFDSDFALIRQRWQGFLKRLQIYPWPR